MTLDTQNEKFHGNICKLIFVFYQSQICCFLTFELAVTVVNLISIELLRHKRLLINYHNDFLIIKQRSSKNIFISHINAQASNNFQHFIMTELLS